MLLVSLVSTNLTNYGRRQFKLFTNCDVWWDTLYKPTKYTYKQCVELNTSQFREVYF